MKYLIPFLSLVIVAVGAILGVSFRDDLFCACLFELSGLAVAVPLTVILGVVVLGLVLAKRRPWKAVSYSLVVSASCVVALFVFMETGSLINSWKVDAVERYVARAVPVLDGIKQKEGSYPATLPTDLLGAPPELLRRYGDYTSTGSTFRFEYDDDPAEWAGGPGPVTFDSASREWKSDQ
jgi:hypothetical protein